MKLSSIKINETTDITKVFCLLPISESINIPLKYATEIQVRRRCTLLNKKGYLFKASTIGLTDAIKVTRLK